jgi:translation elongation factor EF-Ts
MSDEEFPYLKVRAVRDETGASHDECRQVLRDSDGNVAAAVALWFARRRGHVIRAPGEAPATDRQQSPSTRSQ